MKNQNENKSVLNKECSKVLGVIVKNADITATKIQKRLRWGFIPTRALGFLRDNKFVTVNKDTKGYTVNAAGTDALAGYVAPKRRKVKAKSKVKKTKVAPAPVVAADPVEPVNLPDVMQEPDLAAELVEAAL